MRRMAVLRRLQAIVVIAALCVAAGSARAGDEPVLPTIEEIAATVALREGATFPLGLKYSVTWPRNDNVLSRPDPETAALLASGREETLWCDESSVVWRKFQKSVEWVFAYDGESYVTIGRQPGAEWKGTIKRGYNSSIEVSPYFHFYYCKDLPLSKGLAAGARVLGWGWVEDRRCVTVYVGRNAPFDRIYELDPERGFVPLRVSIVCPADFVSSQSEPMTRVKFPVSGADPCEFQVYIARTATSVIEPTPGAFIVSEVKSVWDESRPAHIVAKTSDDAHSEPWGRDYRKLVSGVVSIIDQNSNVIVPLSSSHGQVLAEQARASHDELARFVDATPPATRSSAFDWVGYAVGLLVGLVVTAGVLVVARRQARGDSRS